VRDDDPNADLRLHSQHGTFQLDMTVATTGDSSWYGRVPAPQDPGLQVGDAFWAFANYYSSNVYNTATDAEWAQTVHAVFMCLAFLLVFPLGAISLRLLRRAVTHAIIQIVGLGLVVIGFGLGVYASRMYNKVSL
jgi:lipopolysaccharide export LptBFGC system permease protein LptF